MKKITFILAAFILGLISIVSANNIEVAAGMDGIKNAYDTASPGDVIVLTTSGGEYLEPGKLYIQKDISIVAAEGLEEKPQIINYLDNTFFKVDSGSVTLKGVVLQGYYDADGNDTTDTVIKFGVSVKITDSTKTHVKVKILDCIFNNFVSVKKAKGIYVSSGSVASVDSLIIRNTIFRGISQYAMYLRKGYKTVDGVRVPINDASLKGAARYFELSNCLFDNYGYVAPGFGVLFESWEDSLVTTNYPTATPEDYLPTVKVDHCTFVNFIKTGLRFQNSADITVKNSIFAYADTTGGGVAVHVLDLGNNGSVNSTVHNVLYWVDDNGGPWVDPLYADTVWSETILADTDPMFADTINYALKEGSPGKNAGDDGKDLGFLGDITTAIENESITAVPQTYSLEQNYPNPFNPTTTIKYNVPETENVKISVYNVLGQEVAVLLNKKVNAGNHTIEFKVAELSSGVYIYRMEAGSFTSYKKMIIMK